MAPSQSRPEGWPNESHWHSRGPHHALPSAPAPYIDVRSHSHSDLNTQGHAQPSTAPQQYAYWYQQQLALEIEQQPSYQHDSNNFDDEDSSYDPTNRSWDTVNPRAIQVINNSALARCPLQFQRNTSTHHIDTSRITSTRRTNPSPRAAAAAASIPHQHPTHHGSSFRAYQPTPSTLSTLSSHLRSCPSTSTQRFEHESRNPRSQPYDGVGYVKRDGSVFDEDELWVGYGYEGEVMEGEAP